MTTPVGRPESHSMRLVPVPEEIGGDMITVINGTPLGDAVAHLIDNRAINQAELNTILAWNNAAEWDRDKPVVLNATAQQITAIQAYAERAFSHRDR